MKLEPGKTVIGLAFVTDEDKLNSTDFTVYYGNALEPMINNRVLHLKDKDYNPVVPVAPGEEHWLLDTSLDEVYWPCSHSRAIPSFPSQLEWKIGLAWANTRGSLNSPS